MLNERQTRRLLDDLCTKLGFCSSPEVRQSRPPDVLSFIDAVFVAEGMDPHTVDRHLYRQVRDMVAEAFRHAEDEGV